MTVSIEEVKHVARLAKLEFSETELAKMATEMDAIVGYVEQLKHLNVEGIQPTAHALDIENVFREDKVAPPMTVEEALQNAPAGKSGYFSVPKVL